MRTHSDTNYFHINNVYRFFKLTKIFDFMIKLF